MFIAGSNTKFWNFYGVCKPEDTDKTSILFASNEHCVTDSWATVEW